MIFKYENVVLGGSFDAVYLAFSEGWPIIYKELEKPFEKDLVGDRNKRDFYDFMVFLLTIADLNPFSSKVADIRIDENKIIVSGHKPWIYEVEAINVHNFLETSTKQNKVVDILRLKQSGIHDITEIQTKDKFVNQVIVKPGPRRTEFVEIISYLTNRQLQKEEYSQIYSMLAAKKLLKEAGMKGRKKGIERRKGFVQGQRYRGFALQFIKRDVYKIDNEKKHYVFESKHPYITNVLKRIYARKSQKIQEFSSCWNNSNSNTTV